MWVRNKNIKNILDSNLSERNKIRIIYALIGSTTIIILFILYCCESSILRHGINFIRLFLWYKEIQKSH